MVFHFNFNTFFNYYNNPANRSVDNTVTPGKRIFLYQYRTKTGKNGTITRDPVEIYKDYPTEYVTVNGEKLYFTTYESDRRQSGKNVKVKNVLFTRPILDGGKEWDQHYHFMEPLNNYTKINANKNIIAFHKTNQIPSYNKEECWLDSYVDIEDCWNNPDKCGLMECWQPTVNSTDDTLGKKFPNKLKNVEEYKIIGELITRPFYGIRMLGGKRKTCKNKKHSNKTKRNFKRS